MTLEQLNVEIDSSLLDAVFEKAGRKAKKRLVVEEALREWLASRSSEAKPRKAAPKDDDKPKVVPVCVDEVAATPPGTELLVARQNAKSFLR